MTTAIRIQRNRCVDNFSRAIRATQPSSLARWL